eukprot:COSAG02_NODE_62986_length_264_cov_0.921212_1_plen_52_part_10
MQLRTSDDGRGDQQKLPQPLATEFPQTRPSSPPLRVYRRHLHHLRPYVYQRD